jgi:hypothetical protein
MTISYRIYLTDVADTEVEVQAYVAGWSTQRGRSRELDTFSAGTFSLSLQNYDGRFLPEAFNGTTSPYGSDVAVPGRGCRIQVDGGDGWRTVFYGFVEDTAWDYDNQRVVGARVTGVDSMGRVARLSMQSDLAVWTATGTNTSGTWIDLVLEDAGWDTDNDFDSDFTTESLDRMILAATTGDNALSTAQQFVRTEGFARLFASKDDEDIQYQGRYWTVGASSALTFGTGGIPIDSVGMAVSSELLYNQVITKSTNTATVVEDDSTSQGVYGLRSLSRTDLVFDTLAATRAYAEAYLEEFKTPQARLESLTVNLRDLTAAQIDDVLALEIGDVVTVTFTPRGADEVDLEFVVEGIAHQAYPGPEHGVTFQLSPRPTINQFELDTDELDTDRIGF